MCQRLYQYANQTLYKGISFIGNILEFIRGKESTTMITGVSYEYNNEFVCITSNSDYTTETPEQGNIYTNVE